MPAQTLKTELILTGDGSHTLYLPEWDETYHSRFGAIQESLHIFIHNGFMKIAGLTDTLKILEMGFGTGLNALLTLHFSLKHQIPTEYTAIESHPLEPSIYTLLNYPLLIESGKYQNDFLKLHEAEGKVFHDIHPYFRFRKIFSDIEKIPLAHEYYHLIYFDAFAPDVQPELWTEEIFRKIYAATVGGGLLVTYSSKGSVKRNLKAAGFSVEKIAGPPGKREFIRATKP